jgi:hypothetical protein
MAGLAKTSEWNCARCGVTARFMDGIKAPEIPSGWGEDNGVTYCLACRRELAGEAGAAAAANGSPEEERQANAVSRIEFEIMRAPDQGDTRVARACRTSVAAVRRVRERLGAYPTRPS